MKIIKICSITLLLAISMMAYSQIPGPGDAGPTIGASTPLDGGLLMALLAGGGIIAGLVRKKKEKM